MTEINENTVKITIALVPGELYQFSHTLFAKFVLEPKEVFMLLDYKMHNTYVVLTALTKKGVQDFTLFYREANQYLLRISKKGKKQ